MIYVDNVVMIDKDISQLVVDSTEHLIKMYIDLEVKEIVCIYNDRYVGGGGYMNKISLGLVDSFDCIIRREP